MQYMSPAAAFSSTLEQSLLQRANAERQAQMDQLAMQRELRAQKQQDEEHAQAMEALAEKRREFGETQKEKRKTSFEKTLSTMLPSDIPSPELVEQSKEFGMGHLFPADTDAVVKAVPTPVGIAADPEAVTPEMPAPVPQAPLPVRFLGSPKQRTDAADKAEQLKYIATLPAGPERMALEYEAKTGKTAPAGMFKGADDSQSIARVDSKRQVVQQLINGVWTDVKGDVPKGTHFIQEPTAPSTFGQDLRRDAARTHAYDRATTELNKTAAPFEDQMKNLEMAETAVNERSPTGDAHVAPMILKALVAGQGSGFRMTKSEIDQVQNARSKWDSMEAAFRKWDSGDKASLFFGDAQRAEFLHLIEVVRKATQRHLEPVERARREIDDIDDPRDIQKRLSALHTERTKTKDSDTKDAAGPKRSPADVWKQYSIGAKQ